MALNIVCCIKQVPDPETPASVFQVDEAAKKVVPVPGVPPVVSQFDAIAVEAALRIRDAERGGKITVLSLGPQSARDAIRACLSMGADEGVLLDDPAFADGDSYSTAVALAAAIRKIGAVDIVLCGRQAVDWDFGVTGLAIAEFLGCPSVTLAKRVSVSDGKVQVERVLGSALETLEVPMPCVVTVSNELGEPRFAKLPQIKAAARKEIPAWSAADLGLETQRTGRAGARLELQRLYVPVVDSHCEFMDGDTPEAMAANLARALRAAKLI